MIACVARAPFTRSSSNHSSRKSAALIVNRRTSSWMSRPVQPRNRPAVRAHRGASASRMFGGTTNRRSFRSSATRSKYASNATHASASWVEQSADVLPVARHVAPERERRPVRERHEVVGRDDRDVVAVPLQLELVDDPLRHEGDDIRGARHLVAGPRLLGDGRAAEHASPFEDQRRPGRLSTGRPRRRGRCGPRRRSPRRARRRSCRGSLPSRGASCCTSDVHAVPKRSPSEAISFTVRSCTLATFRDGVRRSRAQMNAWRHEGAYEANGPERCAPDLRRVSEWLVDRSLALYSIRARDHRVANRSHHPEQDRRDHEHVQHGLAGRYESDDTGDESNEPDQR